MAYVKTVWETGDVITAEKLNHAENGIATANNIIGNLIIHVTVESDIATLDQKWQDIFDAFSTGVPCIISGVNDGLYYQEFVQAVYSDEGTYYVGGSILYSTESATGYPSANIQPG